MQKVSIRSLVSSALREEEEAHRSEDTLLTAGFCAAGASLPLDFAFRAGSAIAVTSTSYTSPLLIHCSNFVMRRLQLGVRNYRNFSSALFLNLGNSCALFV